jgi:hypothetical protein
MARRWLLTILGGMTLSVGVAASPASAQSLTGGDPVVVEVADVATVTATSDADEPSATVEADAEAAAPEAGTTTAPQVTAEVSPDDPSLEVDGGTEVGDEPVPTDEVTDPVEDAVDDLADTLDPPAPAPPAPEPPPATEDPTPSLVPAAPAPAPTPAGSGTTAAGDDVAPAAEPVPGPAPVTAGAIPAGVSRGGSARTVGADGAWAAAPADDTPGDDELAPLVAGPADAPATPTSLALPVVDPTPTVPGLLRLFAGLMVVGAAVTWTTVRKQLA